ncbi:MAG: enoyl-CoA hydratase/isomerase family protein [Novosphingobium sp.]
MDLNGLTIDAQRLWAGEAPLTEPIAFVDLDRSGAWPEAVRLPACPVIGLGDPQHPLADRLDAVVEPPIGAEMLARRVAARPEAAAVTVQLLRSLPSLGIERALVAESFAYGLLQGSGAHREWIRERVPQSGGASRRVEVERSGERLTITLADPASGNAVDRTMRDTLYEAFALAALDADIRAVSLRAVGRTFSLGAELAEFGTMTDPATAHAIRMQTLPAWMIARCADRLDVLVQGACVGAGLEMAAWARHFAAAPGAWFQLPELAMGVLPGAGGCVSLTRRIGRQRTALLILSGKRINARTALGWGLVDEIVDQPA